MTTTTYGLHLTLRLSEVERRDVLDDCQSVGDLLVSLVHRIGMRILAGPLAGREEGDRDHSGCSGVVILYESHAAIHTYPDRGELFLDIFSCRPFEAAEVIELLRSILGYFRIVEQATQQRGIHWSFDIDREMNSWMHTRMNPLSVQPRLDPCEPALLGAGSRSEDVVEALP
jgi:S-adenosylmethionine decarboxylase